MKQWDTVQWVFPHGSHPAVIVSPPARCENADCETVNVLGCSSHRANRLPGVHEAMLLTEDGLSWETLCRLDVVWLVNKSELKQTHGSVQPERRREIGAKLIRLFGFWLP